ncbi:MAG: V-type ATPase subunit [Clostridia bacterium]|nr:V-type ATPase subunit [Clostridia bacterium]
MKLQQTDYMYCSARIRAMEARLIGRDACERMLESRSAVDAMAQIGVGEAGRTPADREAYFAARLEEAYASVVEMLPDDTAIRFLQYPYDCNNVKAAIKCSLRGIDCAPMLIGCGTIPVSAFAEMAAERDFSALPANMAAAAARACDAYAASGDPQQIDLLLDRACYADMLADTTDDFARALVRAKIDLTNMMMFFRVMRMGVSAGSTAMLEEALLAGGEIPPERFLHALRGGDAKLADVLQNSVCRQVLARFEEAEPSLAALECACDNVWMAMVAEAKFVPFGPALPVAYLLAWEYAVKNMRIICAGKDAGLDRDTIRERMRDCYA